MNDGNIFIQKFTFNRKLRILQHAESIIQLRKKEADVLLLLCEKYPNPVLQDDFLMEVWGGGYVTSQSIAQVIRSLRLNLGDEKKSTISTIPKLGYKLTVAPIYEDALPTKFQYGEVIKINHDRDDFSYTEQQSVINVMPSSSSISIIPYTPTKKRFFSTRRLILSSVILIFGSLACVTLSARSILADKVKHTDEHDRKEPPALVVRQKKITNNVNRYMDCCFFSDDSFASLLKNHAINDGFIN